MGFKSVMAYFSASFPYPLLTSLLPSFLLSFLPGPVLFSVSMTTGRFLLTLHALDEHLTCDGQRDDSL